MFDKQDKVIHGDAFVIVTRDDGVPTEEALTAHAFEMLCKAGLIAGADLT